MSIKRNAVATVAALVACLVAMAGSARAELTAGLPKGTNLTSLIVISDADLGTLANRVMIATLQGIVARKSGKQIYIEDSSSSYNSQNNWDRHLNAAYGIPLTNTTDPWWILNQFASLVSGYILYDTTVNSNSINTATSLCGPFNAIAVDASIETAVRNAGVRNRVLDVRTHDEPWAWTNQNARFSRDVVVEQKEWFTDRLRDYAVLSGAFTFFDGNSPFRTFVMSQMNPDSACLGWGDATFGEGTFVGDSSSNGVYTVAADYALNLSTLSSVRDPSVHQRTYAVPAVETNVHYVTFLWTDGDNLQFNLGTLVSLFNDPARGRFSMGWAVSPTMADLAPSALRWYYDNSSNSPAGRDFFVAGPSGCGYFFPGVYPPGALATDVQKVSDYMARADMNIVQIIDSNTLARVDLWNQYLAQPSIDALFYLDSPYDRNNGAVYFSTNGKPIITPRNLLWVGVWETSNTNVIARINSYPRDPSSPAGYTLVLVHVWTKTLEDVLNVVTNLTPDVRVVTPGEFVRLIRDNVGRKLSYDFAGTTQGWTGAPTGYNYGNTGRSDEFGPALWLDGSDNGTPDSLPNSSFSRQIVLPPNATAFSFDTMAVNDGLLRVRLQLPDGTFVTLLDWEGLTNRYVWVNRSASLINFAGQNVTIWFEQNDGGLADGEYRFVNNVAVLTAGPAQYLPDPPRLLSVAAGYCVNLLWRDNDTHETGFKIERQGTNGVWAEIATVSGNVTTYTDCTATPGASYAYRMRSWNAQGYSSYSSVRVATGSVLAQPVPVFGGAAIAGTNLVFHGKSGPSNGTYYVLASTNLTMPWSNWTRLATNAFDANGYFLFSNTPGANTPRQFYLLQLH